MATGKLKWFNHSKGYGFIEPNEGGKEIFVHISAFQGASITNINDNMDLSYDLVQNNGKECAGNLQAL